MHKYWMDWNQIWSIWSKEEQGRRSPKSNTKLEVVLLLKVMQCIWVY